MQVASVGAGLAGMATAVASVKAGREIEIFESHPLIGGKAETKQWGDRPARPGTGTTAISLFPEAEYDLIRSS